MNDSALELPAFDDPISATFSLERLMRFCLQKHHLGERADRSKVMEVVGDLLGGECCSVSLDLVRKNSGTTAQISLGRLG